METFVSRIEELLKTQNITKKDFCNAVSIPVQCMYDWRNKGSIPSAVTAVKIAQYLHTTVEYLVTGEENPLVKQQKENIDNLKQSLISLANKL